MTGPILPEFATVPAGRLPGFRLTVVPVTAGQYWSYLADAGLAGTPAPRLHGPPVTLGTGLRSTVDGGVEPEPQRTGLPATSVTWHGAVAYCAWLADRLRTPCRLPTAAEWQYAAAGPAGWRWSLGDEFDRPTYAPAADGPRPVGATPANPYGLRDMTGNVFEWCADPLLAPDGTALGSRTIKGGAYTVRNPESFENATVFTADELSAVPYIGFRVLAAGTGTGR